jgi:hypothetical protein
VHEKRKHFFDTCNTWSSTPGKKWDVYMEPLYDDLKLLWDGVQVYDRSVRSTFKLRACHFYSVHDLPALVWSLDIVPMESLHVLCA